MTPNRLQCKTLRDTAETLPAVSRNHSVAYDFSPFRIEEKKLRPGALGFSSEEPGLLLVEAAGEGGVAGLAAAATAGALPVGLADFCTRT